MGQLFIKCPGSPQKLQSPLFEGRWGADAEDDSEDEGVARGARAFTRVVANLSRKDVKSSDLIADGGDLASLVSLTASLANVLGDVPCKTNSAALWISRRS